MEEHLRGGSDKTPDLTPGHITEIFTSVIAIIGAEVTEICYC